MTSNSALSLCLPSCRNSRSPGTLPPKASHVSTKRPIVLCLCIYTGMVSQYAYPGSLEYPLYVITSSLDAESVLAVSHPLAIMPFTTVLYPPRPPTSNSFSAEERAHLVRSAKKLGKVLGTTPQLIDETCPICDHLML